jgi:hypothetical protein
MRLRARSFLHLSLVAAAIACAEQVPTRALPNHVPPLSFDLTPPDSATYVNGGGSLTGFISGTMSSLFIGGNSSFSGAAHGTASYVSDASFSATVWVVKNTDGTSLGSSTKGASVSMAPPSYWNVDSTFYPSASTLNHTCGVTGKSTFTGSADQKLMTVNGTITSWSGSYSGGANDVTLSDCPTYTDPVPCGNEIVYDPSDCPSEGARGGSPEAPDPGCTEELFVIEISWDGGSTWTYLGEYWDEQC